jgi:hypothetical protein
MPKPPKILIVSLVLTYAWFFAWLMAGIVNKDLPGMLIGGIPASILYIYVGGGLGISCTLSALLAWYLPKKSKKNEELLRTPKEEGK